ncbi:hypothetical protein [Salsuginibacillus kocurii]|uniref:hypothetical protein n=1 Tax=Salsuginibacillus kocurii TaxID=427078 RepID=UPI00035C12A6|nr:hypothetical protein [Salsuginibacillus kocurii]
MNFLVLVDLLIVLAAGLILARFVMSFSEKKRKWVGVIVLLLYVAGATVYLGGP